MRYNSHDFGGSTLAMRGCGNVFSAIKTGRRAAVLLAALCFIGSARADSGIESWSALQAAIDAASGDAIVLTESVTAGESDTAPVIPDGLEITLDLNGPAQTTTTGIEEASLWHNDPSTNLPYYCPC